MNCIILTAIRSGSTYLINLLKGTKYFHYPATHSFDPSLIPQRAINEFLAPNPYVDPWFVEKRENTKQECISYFKHKSSFKKEEPVLLKFLMEQYQYYMFDDTDRDLVEECFPNTKYIWLERNDIIARTISAYIFYKTKTPHVLNEFMMKEYMKKKNRIQRRRTIKCL